MSETAIAFNCPNCGADLEFDAEKQKLCCEFCLSEFTKEEFDSSEVRAQNEDFCSQMQEYQCPNCGAEFVTDADTVAGSCAYCHSAVILKGRLIGQMKPDKIIPFIYNKEKAEEKFFEFIKNRWFLPSDFKSTAHADKIKGVYYPFWVTDADTTASVNASCTKVRVWRVGDTETTETTRFNVRRSGDIHFEDIVSSAISSEDKEMLEGILPYPSDAIEDFSMHCISGFSAKKRNIETRALSDEVRGRMNGYAETLLKNSINGYATTSVNSKKLDINRIRWEYTFMPVWVLNYKTKNKDYIYAMNGYTGKIYGKLPLSVKKLLIGCTSVFASVAAIVALIGGTMF